MLLQISFKLYYSFLSVPSHICFLNLQLKSYILTTLYIANVSNSIYQYFCLNVTKKCDIGQLSALHDEKCNVTLSADGSMKSAIFGAIGFDPFVFTVRISECSPSPTLFV